MEKFANGKRSYIESLPEKIGEIVVIAGSVNKVRDHGKVIFLDIKDMTGNIQTVATIDQPFFAKLQNLKTQSFILFTGEVKSRPEKLINPNEPLGAVELGITEVEILSEATEMPWGTESSDAVNEELRLKYRYLDLRSDRMQRNLRTRDNIVTFLRQHFHENHFVEIETPILTKDSPEGAREFVVPSRLQKGSFYALPQAPQQFKQLLMVAGFERYFQIAHIFRDEDPRGDRQPEFTQVDYEMSYATQEDVWEFTEEMLIKLVETLFPEHHISTKPFPRLTYQETMEKYGTDRPDMRQDKNDPKELAFAWIYNFPMFEKTKDGKITFMHNPFTQPVKADWDKLDTDPLSVTAEQYDMVINGYELSSGSVRTTDPKLLRKILGILGYSPEDIDQKFGHMIKAYEFGAPPHAGFAPGLDRLVMILQNEPNIREVIAFPKTGDMRDLMMDAPSPIGEKELKDLGLTITKKVSLPDGK